MFGVLPLVLFNYCFVVQDVQENVSAFCPLKHWRVCIMHCELGKSLSCPFTSRHANCHKSADIGLLPFTLVATFIDNVPSFPMPTLLFKEVCKKGVERLERLWLLL